MAKGLRLSRLIKISTVVPLVVMACANADERATSGAAAGSSPPVGDVGVLQLRVSVVSSYPHDPEAFTQGLLWFEGKLYESTGLRGQSSVRRVELQTGTVERKADLAPTLFGEGLARVGESLIQLTWQSGQAIRYDVASLAPQAQHAYAGEGWGLCHDGVDLWRSDGSSTLRRHDPEDLGERGQLAVRLRGEPVEMLNELECAEGWIYANVLNRKEIVRIDPGSGRVMAVVDASELPGGDTVQGRGPLNGIAYRPESQTFLLTGKRWPKLFEVVFVQSAGTR